MKSPREPLHKNQNNYVDGESMYVEGSLALLLRICRCCGVSPLRSSHEREGWRVEMSPMLAALQGIFVTLLNIAITAGVIIDFSQAPESRVRVGHTFMKAFIWIADCVLVLVIASLAVYAGPAQTKNLRLVLNQLQQIKKDLSISDPSSKTEKKKSIAIILTCSGILLVLSADLCLYFRVSSRKDSIWVVMCLYSAYYVADLQGTLVTMKWAFVAHTVYSAAAALNERMQSLGHAKLKRDLSGSQQDDMNTTITYTGLVDCFTKQTKAPSITSTGSDNTIPASRALATIHRLSLTHERISEVIRLMTEANGPILLTILMSTFLRLVLTPYYMITRLLTEDQNLSFEIWLSFSWSLVLMAILMMTIEPCHCTHTERERTGMLLGQLIIHVSPKCERLSKELDQFAKQFYLNTSKFMPLGVYTLSRPLMATMLGSVTTYLLIIIQFEKVSNQL